MALLEVVLPDFFYGKRLKDQEVQVGFMKRLMFR